MTNLILVGAPDNGVTEDELFDRLKGRKFVAIYIDENDKYKSCQQSVSDEEICYMANLLINRLLND